MTWEEYLSREGNDGLQMSVCINVVGRVGVVPWVQESWKKALF